LLHALQVHARVEQLGGKGMPQAVFKFSQRR
jgi:hypothetical protein